MYEPGLAGFAAAFRDPSEFVIAAWPVMIRFHGDGCELDDLLWLIKWTTGGARRLL